MSGDDSASDSSARQIPACCHDKVFCAGGQGPSHGPARVRHRKREARPGDVEKRFELDFAPRSRL